jgi:hypothetical protein
LLSLATAPAFSQECGTDASTALERSQQMIGKADADANAHLDRNEAKANFPILHRNFDTVDSDKDCKVSVEGVRSFIKGRADNASVNSQGRRAAHPSGP